MRPKGSQKTPGSGRKPGSQNKATAALQTRLLADQALTVETTVEAIRRGALYDVRAYFDENGNLRNIKDLSEAEAAAIASFEILVKNAVSGDGHQDTVHKIRLVNRDKYLDIAAKYQGMFVEQVQHTGGIVLSWQLPGQTVRTLTSGEEPKRVGAGTTQRAT